jgi:UbiD family decarboxylase
VFTADAVFHRKDAIYPATVVGKPRQEEFFYWRLFAGTAIASISIGNACHPRSVESMARPDFTLWQAASFRSVMRERRVSAAFRILGEGQLALTKFLLLTDKPAGSQGFQNRL